MKTLTWIVKNIPEGKEDLFRDLLREATRSACEVTGAEVEAAWKVD